jgi:lysozyme family protein
MTLTLYKLGTDPRFEACLLDTELEEGPVAWAGGHMPVKDYTDDRFDPGGKTGEGITQKEYDLWRKSNGLPTQWVYQMTKDEERTIYYQSYWLPHCQSLPPGLDLCLFDTNVNNGTHAGTVLLQRALGLVGDGDWGPQTQSNVMGLTHQNTPRFNERLIDTFCDARLSYYKSLRQWGRYGKDWGRREEHVRNWAHGLAAGSGAKPDIARTPAVA